MIHVEKHTDGSFVVKLDVPEQVLLREISVGYSFPQREAMAAVIYKGIEVVGKQLVKVADDKMSQHKPENGRQGG